MLRTHGELGYRQEQRFHLELGLLKMSHAQRLLPIEQILSGAALPAPTASPKPIAVPEARRSEPSTARASVVSPFAADSARKTGSKPEMSATETAPFMGPRAVPNASPNQGVVMGAAAPAQAPEPMPSPETSESAATGLDPVRAAVLDALSGHQMCATMLDAGEWSVVGNELVIKVAASDTIIDMTVGPEAKRLAIATASGALGRPVKLKVVSGGVAQPASNNQRSFSNGGSRGRAEQDPVVRRMKEKFGAEIRTVIDYRQKR
jgi:DNA polymerase-3 subunit gamma/tau